jgi:hypothetical protein
MKQATSLKTLALVALTAAATTFLMQACGGSAEAQAIAPDANVIEGAWESTVANKDCTSGAVLRTFTGESLFHRGGTLTADNSMPVPTRGLGIGVWTQDAANAYTAKFHFLRFNPDGTVAGSQNVVRTIALAADGKSLTSTLAAQVLDAAGTVLQAICGSEVGKRLY